MFVVNDEIQIPLRELRFSFTRSQGPGGQNVNKVNTKAMLRWTVVRNRSLPADVRQRFAQRYKRRMTKEGELVIQSQRFRDRGRNIADCLEKLRHLLQEVAQPATKRHPTKPTRQSKIRRRREKEAQSRKKERRKPPSTDS